MGANKKISELTSGSAIAGTEELAMVQSSSTVKTTISAIKTYFDTIYKATFTENTAFNKNFGTTAGTVLEGNRITQVITNGVTDKAPSEDAVYDALENYTKTIFKDFTVSSALTGTTSNTIIRTSLDLQGVFKVGDEIEIKVVAERSTSVGNVTQRLYYNTSNSLSGATLIATQGPGAFGYLAMSRNLKIRSATETETISSTFSASTSDIAAAATTTSVLNIDYINNPVYFIQSFQNAAIGDSTTARTMIIKKS